MSKTRRKKVFSVLSKIFLALWLLSIILFFVVAIRFGQSKFYGNFMGIDFVLGVTFFFLAIATTLLSQDTNNEFKSQNKHKKRGKSKKPFFSAEQFVLGVTVILLLLIVYLDRRQMLISSKQMKKLYPKTTPISTPSINLKTRTSTLNKTYKEVNNDPVVDCVSSHPNCKGKSLRLKSSQCSQIFCCGFSSGRWVLYSSEEKCKQAWKAQSPTNTINTNVPSYIYSTYTPTTYYNCTLYYPYSKKYITYDHLYRTKAECDSQQAELNQLVVSSTPMPTPQAPQITKSQCYFNVHEKWQSQMARYGCTYPCPDTGDCGPTSVCDILWRQVQRDMSVCEQYP